MPNIWRNSSKRSRGLFLGCTGVASVLFTFAPLWDLPAGADPGVVWGLQTGVAGDAVGFQITGCQDVPGDVDIAIEIDTDPGGNRDQQGFAFAQNNTYVYIAPAEYAFLEGNAAAGPAYQVNVACIEVGQDTLSIVDVGDFTYVRPATTSSTGATTSSTGATTSSTGATTSSTGATTSSTGATTSSTGATTSSTGATTSSTTDATTSTTGGSSTSTTAGNMTSTTVGASVSDSTPTRGQNVTVTAGGFAPGSTVAVDFLSTPVRIGTLTANAAGVASGTVRIPINATAGAHEIRLTGVDAAGATVVRSVAVSVVNELPRTGDDPWSTARYGLLLVGLGLLAAGRSQLLAARR